MDVRCDKCGTDYEFDDDKVSPQGVSVRCTQCGHVFRVQKAQVPQPQPGEWMIRQTNGHTFTFRELTTLQKWIVERKVSRDDEISRNGSTWKKLGSIPELATFFQVLESSAHIAPVAPTLPRQPEPARSVAPISSDEIDQDFDDVRQTKPAGRSGIVVGIVIGLVMAGAGATAVVFKDRLLPPQSGPSPSALESLLDTQLQAALRSYRRDTDAGYSAAADYLSKLVELQANSPSVLSWATVVDIGWAEATREQADDLQNTIKNAASGKSQVTVSELASLASQSAKLQADAAVRAERASNRLKKLLELEANSDEALRAAARVYAFKLQKDAVMPILERAKGKTFALDRELIWVSAALTPGSDAAQAAFQSLVDRDPDDIAARYQLCRILITKKDARAGTELAELLKRAPDHLRAQALKGQVGAASAPASLPAASAPATSSGASGPSAPPADKKPVKETYEGLMKRANQLRQREKAQQALELYERALALQPNDAEALTGLGYCYLDLDAAPAATQEFGKALAANPRYSDAHIGIAEAYRARNQKRDAVKHYQRYLELAPDGPEAEVAKRALKDLGQ